MYPPMPVMQMQIRAMDDGSGVGVNVVSPPRSTINPLTAMVRVEIWATE
jgi:hypothetical protein